MSSEEHQQRPEEQQIEQPLAISTDSAGNALRGRGGDMMGTDRGPVRGGNFEQLRGPMLESSPQGASSSVEGWVLMLSNLSPQATENDLRLLLSDVDPTADLLGGGGGENDNGNNTADESSFISDLKMNPSAATCGCIGHAFIKVPSFAYAQKVQELNGREFVDDMPIRVDFAFQVPAAAAAAAENGEDGAQKDRHHTRGNDDDAGPRRPQRQERGDDE